MMSFCSLHMRSRGYGDDVDKVKHLSEAVIEKWVANASYWASAAIMAGRYAAGSFGGRHLDQEGSASAEDLRHYYPSSR
jgi:hypothetical protein